MSQKGIEEHSDIASEEEASFVEERESPIERAIAFVLCLVVLVLPMVYIQDGYDAFTSEHGEAREGAAGAGLALAVVFRTVSRTVLRTIVRTSARAGVRASLKGAVKNAARTAIRSQTSGILKKGLEEKSEKKISNIKSLLFGSGLLYASWIIVIGLGQPYQGLLNKEDSIAKELQDQQEEEKLRLSIAEPAIEAWRKQKIFNDEQQKLKDLREEKKLQRDATKQEQIEAQIELQKLEVTKANFELTQALQASKDRVMDPNENQEQEKHEPSVIEGAIQYLMTYAPYPGKVTWDSPIIWLGGIVMFLPLWFIFFFQNLAAKKLGAVLSHETEWIGGSIQLYFAAAFSFMPLTSDVMIDTTVEKRGWIALAGLIPATLVAGVLWFVWKQTGNEMILFVADAFLLFPMVQIFPLEPLEGIHLWRWKKLGWLLAFFIIMGMFLFAGSEALKNVI